MTKGKEVIVKEIEEFKKSQKGEYKEFYIGITKDIDRRILESDTIINEHIAAGRYEKNAPLYTAEAETRDVAVEIEQYFQKLGMRDYNPGAKGRADSKYVYCFKLKDEKKQLKHVKRREDWINEQRS